MAKKKVSWGSIINYPGTSEGERLLDWRKRNKNKKKAKKKGW